MNSVLSQPPAFRPSHERPEFNPPATPRSWRATALALAVHGLLVVALTWGVSWKTSDEAASFSAELWTGQTSLTPPPTPPAPPAPEVTVPPPQPVRAAPPPPEPARAETSTPDVDIALEEEKKRAQLRKQRQQQQQAQAEREARAEEAADKKQAKLKDDQARLKKEQAAELAADKAEAAQLKAQQQAQQQAQAAKLDKQKQAAQAAQAAKVQREVNLARLNAQLGSAGATGPSGGGSGRGTAAQGSGASSTYGAIVKAAIKPNVVFTEDVTGNPMAKIEVRLTLDGTIISQRLVASSGNKAWDDAAMNGVTRTRVMPRDVDGRIPDTTLILEMRPRN